MERVPDLLYISGLPISFCTLLCWLPALALSSSGVGDNREMSEEENKGHYLFGVLYHQVFRCNSACWKLTLFLLKLIPVRSPSGDIWLSIMGQCLSCGWTLKKKKKHSNWRWWKYNLQLLPPWVPKQSLYSFLIARNNPDGGSQFNDPPESCSPRRPICRRKELSPHYSSAASVRVLQLTISAHVPLGLSSSSGQIQPPWKLA